MHECKDDFYGSVLSVVILGYIRPEKNFSSLGELQIFLLLLCWVLNTVFPSAFQTETCLENAAVPLWHAAGQLIRECSTLLASSFVKVQFVQNIK